MAATKGTQDRRLAMMFSLEEPETPSMARAHVQHIYAGPESHREPGKKFDAHLAPLPALASVPLPGSLSISRHASTLLTTALQLTSTLGLGVSLRL